MRILFGRVPLLFWSAHRRAWSCALVAIACWLAARTGLAQDSLRLSLAGAEAARLRREAALNGDASNLKLGPTSWNFDTSLGLQFNDNLRSSPTDQQEDLIFRPAAGARMRWPVSEVNTISLTLGAGYALYATHPEYDRPFVTPGSEVALDLYAGDFWINVHDRFSIVENGYLDPTVTGIADYERLDNAAGFIATCDLNKLIAKVGYDHVDYIALGGLQGRPDAQMEVVSSSAGYTIRPGILAGLETGASLIDYWSEDPATLLFYSDGLQWNAGAFYEAQLTQYIRGHASLGYTQFLPDSAMPGQEFSGFYAQLGWNHRVNRFLEYSLGGGRMLTSAYLGGNVDQYFVAWNASWRFLRKTSLFTNLSYQHGKQLGPGQEEYDWLGPGIRIERLLTAKLTASLAYQFYWRTSDLPGRDYQVNVVTLRGIYRF